MQDAVLQQATAIWEVTLKLEESEGHTQIAASLLHVENALAQPKHRRAVSGVTLIPNISGNQQLRILWRIRGRSTMLEKQNSQVHNNAYSMHGGRQHEKKPTTVMPWAS